MISITITSWNKIFQRFPCTTIVLKIIFLNSLCSRGNRDSREDDNSDHQTASESDLKKKKKVEKRKVRIEDSQFH